MGCTCRGSSPRWLRGKGGAAAHISPRARARLRFASAAAAASGGGQVSRPLNHRPKPMSSTKTGRGLVIVIMAALSGPAAVAQNLDQNKPAPKLFADSCATCHRSPRGLAKGRFRLTLYLFLQDHYATNSSSAWALTSYLESVDEAKRTPSRAGAKPKAATAGSSRSSLRPPAPVPTR
jgi:hypothetical protein